MGSLDTSAEYDLLLDAILPARPPRARLHGWGAGEWGRTLRIADWHRLSPVLHSHLSGRDGVPAAVATALQRAYLANAARAMYIQATLERVGEALAASGVEALLLKGAALIQSAYDDPGEREMLDLDLLVRDAQLPAATAALEPLGYRAQPSDDASAAVAQLAPREHHDAPLIGDQRLVSIELHRHIAITGEGRGFTMDGFWKRATRAADSRLHQPAASDLLLHVCLHFTRSRLGGSYSRRNTGGALGQICDIARLVDTQSPDWPVLIAAARESEIGARVFLALFAASTLGVNIPAETLAELRPRDFDPELGRRMVSLRVLREGDHLPPRSVRWMLAPSRDVLSTGWNADPGATLSLARAYLRRARAHSPQAWLALRQPLEVVRDRRLNSQLLALEERP